VRVGRGCCADPRGVRGPIWSRRNPNPGPRSCELATALAPGRVCRGRWNNEAGRPGPGLSLADPSNLEEGTPSWELQSAAVLVLIWGFDGRIWGEEGKVGFPAFCPPDLLLHSDRPKGGFVL
jgi:hypothetical protein